MRMVETAADGRTAVTNARQESLLALGKQDVYAERFLKFPRHVEIQILADSHGNAVWLGGRDCSVQRRHQKLVEEAPPAGIPAQDIAPLGANAPMPAARSGMLAQAHSSSCTKMGSSALSK